MFFKIIPKNNDLTKEQPDTSSPGNSVFVPLVKTDVKPDDIRKPRYYWSRSMPDYPKVLTDSETGAMCYFSPSKNVCRDLGPDFDMNPMNYPGNPEMSSYRPQSDYTAFSKTASGTGHIWQIYSPMDDTMGPLFK